MYSHTKLGKNYLRTLAILYADEASREPAVVKFRKNALRGKLLPNPSAVVLPKAAQDRLATLTNHLSSDYGWNTSAARAFVLTGETPPIHDVLAQLKVPRCGTNGRILLSIHASLPPQAVAEAYQQARSELTGQSRVRRLSTKHTKLVEFCLCYRGETAWRACMEAWNRQCTQRRLSDWKYSKTQQFRRDARAARRRLVDPSFGSGCPAVPLEYHWDPVFC